MSQVGARCEYAAKQKGGSSDNAGEGPEAHSRPMPRRVHGAVALCVGGSE